MVEERQRMGATFLRRVKKGLFTFTMMMKTVRMMKSLVIEIRTFCINFCQQNPYQALLSHIRLENVPESLEFLGWSDSP